MHRLTLSTALSVSLLPLAFAGVELKLEGDALEIHIHGDLAELTIPAELAARWLRMTEVLAAGNTELTCENDLEDAAQLTTCLRATGVELSLWGGVARLNFHTDELKAALKGAA
jgi:hypothetical protein